MVADRTSDRDLGLKIRYYRRQRDITQRELAAQIGISSQQLQKYETGTNRLAVSKLIEIASILEVDVAVLLDADSQTLRKNPDILSLNEVTFTHEALLLVRAFTDIEDADIRRKLVELVQSMRPKQS